MSRRGSYRRSTMPQPNRNSGEKTPLLNSIAMSSSIMMNNNAPAANVGVGWGVATFLLVNTALGAGMLNYPYAYNQIGGILMASLMQVILLIFITSTMVILVYCADFNQDSTYHDVLLSMCGKRAQQLSALSILLTCYGINITFLVIIGDQYDRIFNSLLPGYAEEVWYLDRKFTIFMTSILFIWPMCYAKRLDFLRHASVLGMFAMLYVAFLTVYEHFVLDNATIEAALKKSRSEAMPMIKSNETLFEGELNTETGLLTNGTTEAPWFSDLTRTVKWFQPLAVIPILCFAYQTHEVIVPVYACMKERIMVKFMRATIFSLVLLFVLYNVVGAFGYLTFGKDVPADIMSLYDGKDPVVVVGIVALVIKFITTYPPLMFCGRGALEGLYGEIRQMSAEEFKSSEKMRRIVITTLWFFSTVALAAFAPDISITLQLLGSMASINVFVFPGMCLVSLTGRLRRARYSLLIDENDISGPNQQRAKDYYLISGSYFGAMKKNASRLKSQHPSCNGQSTTTNITTHKRTNENIDQLPASDLNINQIDSFPDGSINIGNNSTSVPYCNSIYERYSIRHNRLNNQSFQACSWMNRSTTGSLIDRLGFSMAPSTVAQIGISRCTSIGLYLFSALLILFGVFIFVLELMDVLGFL